MRAALFIFLFYLSSCSTTLFNRRLIYIDEKIEADIELILNSDSTFLLMDRYGCRQFKQKGLVRKIADKPQTYLLTDTTEYNLFINQFNDSIYFFTSNVDSKSYSVKKEFLYRIITLDTLTMLSNKKAILRNNTFTTSNGDLEAKRVLKIENSIIAKIGKRNYIKTVGENISLERARFNLKNCSTSLNISNALR
jgi:hypothetical protein